MADTNLEERQALEALPKSKLFRGLTFHFHGPITGYTSGKLSRLITKHGGKVSEKVIGRADVSHIILSGQLCEIPSSLCTSVIDRLTRINAQGVNKVLQELIH
jgi:hypothetical protein